MSRILHLYRLQQVDRQLDRVEKRLQEIADLLADNAELRRAKAELAQKEKLLAESAQKLKTAEAAVNAQRIKIEQSDAMLYGGSVKNPKEIQDLQNKVISLKKHLLTLEDRQLEAMLDYEERETALQKAQAALHEVEKQVIQQNSQLNGESQQLRREEEKGQAERASILPAIAPELYEHYTQLRRSKHGVAVAALSQGACDACGATLPPSLKQKARSGSEIVYCPSCQRILYLT